MKDNVLLSWYFLSLLILLLIPTSFGFLQEDPETVPPLSVDLENDQDRAEVSNSEC